MLTRPFRWCPFFFPIPLLPVRLTLSLIFLSTLPYHTVFLLLRRIFPFILHVWPQLTRQLERCFFSHNFSETVATYRRVCQAANLGPMPEKFRSFLFSSLFTAKSLSELCKARFID
jgi:hypothetical protein